MFSSVNSIKDYVLKFRAYDIMVRLDKCDAGLSIEVVTVSTIAHKAKLRHQRGSNPQPSHTIAHRGITFNMLCNCAKVRIDLINRLIKSSLIYGFSTSDHIGSSLCTG